MSLYIVCLFLLSIGLQTVLSRDVQAPGDDYDRRFSALEDVVRLQGIRLREQDVLIQHLIANNKKLNMENENLAKKVVRLEDIVKIQEKQCGKLYKQIEDLKFGNNCQNVKDEESQTDSDLLVDETKDGKMERAERLSETYKRIIKRENVVEGSINGKPLVAFYAYMSSGEVNPSKHHTLLFDVVKTNIGNAYNSYSGYFTAPVSGVYAFSYSVRVFCRSYSFVQLVKNSEVEGTIAADSSDVCDNDSATETMVIQVNSGDVVFVRTHSTSSHGGDILSDFNGRVYFAGWLIG